MAKLNPAEIEVALATLPNWGMADGKLVHDYTFPDFTAAMAFVNHVAILAESANHHPDIDIRYNKVCLALISHDSGGVTGRDVKFALSLDAKFPL